MKSLPFSLDSERKQRASGGRRERCSKVMEARAGFYLDGWW
jgi:hypothetical protein